MNPLARALLDSTGRAASVLAVAGVRRLLLLELRPADFPPTPANGHSVVDLTAEQAAAFAPEWAGATRSATVVISPPGGSLGSGRSWSTSTCHSGRGPGPSTSMT